MVRAFFDKVGSPMVIAVAYIFPFAMLVAAFLDLTTMRLPNVFVALFAAAFFVAAPVAGLGMQDVGVHILAGLFCLVIGFALFIPGWIGGGDAKFFAAAALWIGWSDLLYYALASSVLGGGLTLAMLYARNLPLPAPLVNTPWVARLHDRETGIPFGIAMALAGFALFPQLIWGELLGL